MRFKLIEAKADNDKLIAYVGDEEANRFFKLKDRLKGEQKDLYYWLKKDPKELTIALDSIEQMPTRTQKDTEARKGADLIAENDYYKVYKINTFEAAKKYGANTRWCITGKQSGWDPGTQDNKYWKEYTDHGIEFYFFIDKNGKHKYALASHPDKRDNYEIFDETDERVTNIPNAPEIRGIFTPEKEINGMIIRGTTVIECESNATEAVIPEGITSIENFAFSNCSALTSINIPATVTSIGYNAFIGCISLASITVSEGNTVYRSAGNCIIETASKTLILGCKNSVIPTDGSVTRIGYEAFQGCTKLKSIEIPEGVTSIGSYAFLKCSTLTSINIPASVTSIEYKALCNCISLTSINYNGTKAQWNAIRKGNEWDSNTSNYTIHCTDGDIKKGE